MDTGQVPLISLLTQKMSWLSARQSVLAENVANADMPGYVARDIKAPNFEQLLSGERSSGTLLITNPRHISAGPDGVNLFAPEAAQDANETPTGNSVSLEQEMIKMSDTAVQYQAALNLYGKMVGMLRTAIGGHPPAG